MNFGSIFGVVIFFAISLIMKSLKEQSQTKNQNTYNQGNFDNNEDYQVEPQDNNSNMSQDTKDMYDKDLELFIPKKEENFNKDKNQVEEEHGFSRTSWEGNSLEGHSLEGQSLEGYSLEGISLEGKTRESNKNNTKKQRIKRVNKEEIQDLIYKGEIGSKEIDYNFDKNDLIKGIVMAELLSKPKSFRKN